MPYKKEETVNILTKSQPEEASSSCKKDFQLKVQWRAHDKVEKPIPNES